VQVKEILQRKSPKLLAEPIA